ncbi:MAG TPA: hypothetical protein VG096_11475 [Bryobacteraceae bacterium]|nr:hypothetical protein [Bryobacteraceae bacterium]
MTCTRCRKSIDANAPKCPYCGQPRPENSSGVFQTSTVLISSQGADMVYRSVEEIPPPLRNKLLQSTNNPNSRTILIADRRGRKEIANAMRQLSRVTPHPHTPTVPAWLTPTRKKVILAVIASLAVALVAVLFAHR